MATRLRTQIVTTGPFFQHDPKKTFRQNVRAMMDAVVEQGRADVVQQMRQGEGTREPITEIGDRVSDHVRGRTSSLSGRRWAVTGVVSVNNAGFTPSEGVSLMAAASIVESKTHAFRRSSAAIKRSRRANQAELLKGLQ